jgi:hypothetical protein
MKPKVFIATIFVATQTLAPTTARALSYNQYLALSAASQFNYTTGIIDGTTEMGAKCGRFGGATYAQHIAIL